MKKQLLFICFLTLLFICKAQVYTTIHTSGKHILGSCNDTLILKGVNYSPYNWGWAPSTTTLKISQIALTGANCVRLVWYQTGESGTPSVTYANSVLLDSAVSKCIQAKMIPIIELHDATCINNATTLIGVANWYVQPAIKTIINKYKHSVILNIANEALYVGWDSNPTAAQVTYTATYNTIINSIRTNSITVPIMIDGPDCGTNLDVMSNVGSALITADPLHNVIFSPHAYWYSYANNDSLQMLGKVNYAISKNIPFVFGEIANVQDGINGCTANLNYKALLRICKLKKIGWIAWSWDNDACPIRQLSTNGNFSSLSTYGNDLVNNLQYGLAVNTIKSKYLTTGCSITTQIINNNFEPSFNIYPNPTQGDFVIEMVEQNTRVELFDLLGQKTALINTENNRYQVDTKTKGIYVLKITSVSGKSHTQKIIIN